MYFIEAKESKFCMRVLLSKFLANVHTLHTEKKLFNVNRNWNSNYGLCYVLYVWILVQSARKKEIKKVNRNWWLGNAGLFSSKNAPFLSVKWLILVIISHLRLIYNMDLRTLIVRLYEINLSDLRISKIMEGSSWAHFDYSFLLILCWYFDVNL